VLVLEECSTAIWTVTAAQATAFSGTDINRELFLRSWHIELSLMEVRNIYFQVHKNALLDLMS
jgi:hypothetical protein